MAGKKNGCGYIRKIQLAIRRLGLDEETFRGIYERVTGIRSLSAMSREQRRRVADALVGEGFDDSHRPADASLCQSPQAKLIRHQWLRLKGMGVLRNSSEYALLAYVKRLTGVERMEWLDPGQAAYVIETLKAWVARVENGQVRRADGTSGDAA